MSINAEMLALHGGMKAIQDPLPTFLESEGRTLGAEEERLVLEALRSGCLTRNGGRMVKALEQEFAKKLGVAHAVACTSGTAAIHLAVAAIDPEPGDEFIVPPITDLGSIFPVLWQNCIPVFADVDPVTMTLDPADVERKISPRTRAIIAVHLAGQPCDLNALAQIARKHELVLIEDCAQAYWATYDDKTVGTIGDLACFSLQQSKHITCGEGGLMVTFNSAYARRAELFADKGWPRGTAGLGAGRFLFLAQNYRMSEVQGAIALGQLAKVDEVVYRRRERAELLSRLITGIAGILPPFVPQKTNPSWWLYLLRVDEKVIGDAAEAFGDALMGEGVPAWVRYIVDPLYLSPLFTERRTYGTSQYPFSAWSAQEFKRGLCPNAERALASVIAIHWNENYTEAQVKQIAAAISKVADYFRGKAR
jgi:perosamine synthetase